MARVVVVGIGNVLSSDDGLGPFVARTLLGGWELDADAEAIDAGTPGADLLPLVDGAEAAIFVDAVRDEGAAGTVRRYDRADLVRGVARAVMSPHEPGLRDALLTMEFHGQGPRDVCLWGAIPGSIELGTRLTDPVRRAVPAVVEGVLAELRRLGVGARRREPPRDPDIWWERP